MSEAARTSAAACTAAAGSRTVRVAEDNHHSRLRSHLRTLAAEVLRTLAARVIRNLAARVIRNFAAAGSSHLAEAFLDDEVESPSVKVDRIAHGRD
jgi:carbon monoxide dehydrogenase subunit G